MGQGLRVLALSVSALSLCTAPGAYAQWPSARAVHAAAALAPGYQNDYGDWRQQVRVASPSRHARWNAAPPGAVRVYNRRFDDRWNWRSAPRYRVVYTYYRGDLWFLDPTTGWAYSVDRYGIVYTADPQRGWVYSLGPLTRWTADLLYFFDLYRFDRGYWYCRDYDYFVDLWEDYPRYDYYSYDTAYDTLWDWEPYFNSPTFITYSNNFSVVWVGQVRSHYHYMERNPYYRREMMDSIGLPAMQAAPPRMVSPRAVATTAYWEARDLAGAGMAPPPRGRDIGSGYVAAEAGSIVDAREAPPQVVAPGTPAPGFNAPFPDGTYGFGVRPGSSEDAAAGANSTGGPDSGSSGQPWTERGEPAQSGPTEKPPAVDGGRGPDGSGQPAELPPISNPGGSADVPPQFEEPGYTPPPEKPLYEAPREEPGYRTPREEPTYEAQREEPGYKAPREEPTYEAPREEPSYEAPREEPSYEAPRYEPRYEAPREEPDYKAPREEPSYEAPREEPSYEAPREEPSYQAPREEPSYEAPREEPRYEDPPEEPRDESEGQRDERQEEQP